jgi:hypothetical protein
MSVDAKEMPFRGFLNALNNQWGWNGYTSNRLASSRHMANPGPRTSR